MILDHWAIRVSIPVPGQGLQFLGSCSIMSVLAAYICRENASGDGGGGRIYTKRRWRMAETSASIWMPWKA